MSLNNNLLIRLGDSEHELKPSMKAATAVSNRFNGFQNAIGAVAASDLAAIQFVVRQGVPLKSISTEQLGELVYEAGTRKLMDPVLRYITRLANGGRDPDAEESEAETSDEGNGEV